MLVQENTLGILMVTSLLVNRILQITQKYHLKEHTKVSQFLELKIGIYQQFCETGTTASFVQQVAWHVHQQEDY